MGGSLLTSLLPHTYDYFFRGALLMGQRWTEPTNVYALCIFQVAKV